MTSLDRNMNVNVTATSDQYERGMRRASNESRQFARELKRQEAAAARFREQTGTAMVGVGVAILAGVGMSVKAAVEWESAWAGVSKTVDGNVSQMAALEGQLRSMARELPATHQEIAAVAEAAGQLGIQRENIAAFTRTMINMGVTTNLTAEEAATAFAQLGNVMGTSQGDFDRMGATVVALGNAGASTERDIVALAQRLSGAGKLMGATEPEILALASAMADLGIEAELGGGAIQRTAIKIETAVKEGGDALEGFADVAGLSAQRFATMYENRPVAAIDAFVQGLNRIDESGGNVVGALAELGIKGTQDLSVLLRLKGAGDLLSTSLDRGNKAWRVNMALIQEAQKRYDTTESKLLVAKNNINDLGITIGETLTPALGGMADRLTGFIGTLDSMPGPVKSALGVLGLLGGSLSLVGGAALLAIPKVHAARETMAAMGGAAAKFNKGLGTAARFMTGPWGIALGVATVAALGFASAEAEKEAMIDRVTEALDQQTGAFTSNSRAIVLAEHDSDRLREDLDRLGLTLGDLILASEGNERSLAKVNTALADGRQKLGKYLGASFNVKDHLGEMSGVLGGAKERWESIHTAQQQANESTKTATERLKEYVEEVRKAVDPMFALLDAIEQVDAAQRDYTQAVRKYGKDSPQARQAALDLAKAVSSAEQAALDGDLSFADFREQLRRWVKAGVLTAEQAKAVEQRVRDARKEAERFTGDYEARIHADTSPAERAISNFITQQEKREIGIAITSGQLGGGGKLVAGYAAGGPITGGTPGRDSVPIMGMDGEWMLSKPDVNRLGGFAGVARFVAALRAGQVAGYASGGPVTLDVASNLSGLRRGLSGAIEELRSSFTFGGFSGGGGNAANMALGRQMAAGYGWTGAEWAALRELWIRESGWNSFADNPTSSAFGIPQALTSMHNVGAAYLAGNPGAQIAWGLNYIAGRHGSPLGALAFHNSHNWYDQGGMLKSGQSGSNKSGKPERILSPRQTEAFERLVDSLLGAPKGETSGRQLARAIEKLVELLRQERPGMAARLGGPFEANMMRMLSRSERIDERLARAVNRRDQWAGRRRDLVQGVRGNILTGRDLTSFGAFSPRDVREVLEENLGRVRRFQRQLRRLTRMGFKREIVAQVAQAGPEAGAGLAKTLAEASKAQVAGINKQFAGIGKASKRFSREMGNELYGAGLQVSEGLLRGLRKNRRELRREMRRLGRGMVHDLKSALKISSPSREMEWIGEMAGQGLVGGWERQLSGSWFDTKAIALKQTIPQIMPAPVRAAAGASGPVRLHPADLDVLRRGASGSRTSKIISGHLDLHDRGGALAGRVRDVVVEEIEDNDAWRGRR